jgi:hypothetical protein
MLCLTRRRVKLGFKGFGTQDVMKEGQIYVILELASIENIP